MKHHNLSRRRFVRQSGLLMSSLPLTLSISKAWAAVSLAGVDAASKPIHNTPATLQTDRRIRLSYGEERLVLDDGLQPSMLCTREGTLIVQAQISKKALPRKRIFYPYELATTISHDGGDTWKIAAPSNANEVNLEGSVHQLKDGTIMVLDTYVVARRQARHRRGAALSFQGRLRDAARPYRHQLQYSGCRLLRFHR